VEPTAVNAADGSIVAPLSRLTRTPAPDPLVLAAALAGAAAAIARLDQALAGHPLAQAFLHRARLAAVREQAAVDGQLVDPWHLAATIEGLRLRMDPCLRIIDRADILANAKTALTLHQWIVEPDFDQAGQVQRAEAMLAMQPASLPPLVAAAQGLRAWIESGETRPAMRAALVRFWRKRRLLRLPVPLTGAAALRPEQSWEPEQWLPAFFEAIAREAADGLDLLTTLERAWFDARRSIAGRRKDSHDAAAVDVLAAAPVLSATTLARVLGIAVKTAIRILDTLATAEIAVEVTHRSKRRLFGLKGLAPLAAVVRPPYRPEAGRGRGRPPVVVEEPDLPAPSLAPLTPVERRRFDYSDLEHWMAHMDQAIRHTRRALSALAPSRRPGPDLSSELVDAGLPAQNRLPPTPIRH
jgi:hypothetical protein